jgi:hypothetical protein
MQTLHLIIPECQWRRKKISFMTLSPEQPLVAAGAETTSPESVTITSSSEHAETSDSGVDQVPVMQNILQS